MKGFATEFRIGPLHVGIRIAWGAPHGCDRHGRLEAPAAAEGSAGAGPRDGSHARAAEGSAHPSEADQEQVLKGGGNGRPPLLLLGPGGEYCQAWGPNAHGQIVRV